MNNRRTLRRIRAVCHSGKASILEIGIGSGSFLKYAKTRGYSPVGCDLSAALCRNVERTTGIEVHCGPLSSLPEERHFDVVVMNHVLEHVSEPVELLKSAHARLKPGGVLHLAAPNVASWEAQVSSWISYQPYHLTYFTPRTLRAAVEKAGFGNLQVMTHESFSGWFLVIIHGLLRKRHSALALQRPKTRTGHLVFLAELAYRMTMAIWGLITLPLRWLQKELGKGDELIIVAQKY